MRLIDEADVVKAIDKHTQPDGTLDDDISCILEEVPTAFDKDKVIDDLNDRVRDAENCAAKYDEIGDIDNMDLQDMAVICYEISIKIVEKGGIE